MIVYSGTKERFQQDVMSNDIPLFCVNQTVTRQREEIAPESLNLDGAGIIIPNAESE